MSNDPLSGWVQVRLQTNRFFVQPGKTVTIPVDLLNPGAAIDHLEFSVLGIPAEWLGASLPIVMLPPQEPRQVIIVVQPPPYPQVQAGIYPLQVRVASLRTPARAI